MIDTDIEAGQLLELVFGDEAADPHDRPCEARRKECPNFALYRLNWRPVEDELTASLGDACHCGPQRLCLACKDWVLSQPDQGSAYWVCNVCKGFVTLASVEPIR